MYVSSVKQDTAGLVSIFELTPTEEDFIPTHAITNRRTFSSERERRTVLKTNPIMGTWSDEGQAVIGELQELANRITIAYDAKRKAEKEAKGQVWQTVRRSTKQVVRDRRAEAEAEVDFDVDGSPQEEN